MGTVQIIPASLGPTFHSQYEGWRYCVVTEIDGVLRPLAIVEHNNWRPNWRPNWPFNYKFTGIDDISGVTDRQAITSSSSLTTVLLDPANRMGIESERATAVNYYREAYSTPMPPFPRGYLYKGVVRRFPFIETCLLLGTTIETNNRLSFDLVSLDTIYHDGRNPGKGMVLFDITDLDNLRYGFVLNRRLSKLDNGDIEMEIIKVEEEHRILSARRFQEICHLENELIEETRKLERFPIIDGPKIDFVWPSEKAQPCPYTRPNSLCHQAVKTLIKSTLEIESFDMSIFDVPRLIPNFKNLLQECLLEYSEFLNHTESAGQLIGLAFEGTTHLNLVRFGKIPVEAICFALQTDQLISAKSLSICFDPTYDSPIEIIDVLSQVPSLRELCLYHAPTRKDNEVSTAFMRAFSMRPEFSKRVKVMFPSVFSATLNHILWASFPGDSLHCDPPPEIFPVQHVFRLSRKEKIYRRCTYLGNELLKAEAFAARFLRWLSQPTHGLFPFSIGPSSLEDLSRLEVSPVSTYYESPGFKPWSWALFATEGFGMDKSGKTCDLPDVSAVKYAFVRLRVDRYMDIIDPATYKPIIKPGQVEVTGLKGFLKATASNVDLALLDQLVVETVQTVANREGRPQATSGLEWISVMTHDEAYAFLNYLVDQLQLSISPKAFIAESRGKSRGIFR
ncbi:hypothetical protein F4776DRAFT_676376 [Hypoxylon sp. NC0597]|nr:hypothetical protein F4776DRAFT_676376 [Hypoxylon sp. NC0597]